MPSNSNKSIGFIQKLTVKFPSTVALYSSLAWRRCVGRCITLVIKNCGSAKRTIGLEGEKGIVRIPPHSPVVIKVELASGSVALNSPTIVPMGWFSAIAGERWR